MRDLAAVLRAANQLRIDQYQKVVVDLGDRDVPTLVRQLLKKSLQVHQAVRVCFAEIEHAGANRAAPCPGSFGLPPVFVLIPWHGSRSV
jgi:hypothetical protein